MTTKKAVLYARVSSNRQEREGYSIPAQIRHGHNYATKNNIKIVAEFVEPESGRKAGRTEFNNMIKFLKKNTTVKIIIVEKTDRIYRNLRDYVTIDETDVEIHFFKTGDVISDKSTSQQKFMHGIRVLMAKNYLPMDCETGAIDFIINLARGDARYALNVVENAYFASDLKDNRRNLTVKIIFIPICLKLIR